MNILTYKEKEQIFNEIVDYAISHNNKIPYPFITSANNWNFKIENFESKINLINIENFDKKYHTIFNG